MSQINISTGNEYAGSNADTLAHSPHESNQWGTFLQWKQAGYSVKKGEKGTKIVKIIETKDGEKKRKKKGTPRRAIRTYTVFNREQVADTLADTEDGE